jgi:ataxin-3
MVDEEEQLRIALAVSEAMAREQGGDRTGSGDAAETRERSDNVQAREGRAHSGRVYDDEDADFQAALQASLEMAPPGAHTPNTTASSPRTSARPPPPASRTIAGPHTEPFADADDGEDEDDDDYESYSDDDQEDTATEVTSSDAGPPPTAQDVSVEEMRRRRLARFGG